jgi:hypothetical protein
MILEHVSRRIAEYDRQTPKRYNRAADSVYSARRESRYGADGTVEAMVVGLEAFGMSRVMGSKADRPSTWTKRFQLRVEIVTGVLGRLIEASLVTVNLETHRETISDCYELLSGASSRCRRHRSRYVNWAMNCRSCVRTCLSRVSSTRWHSWSENESANGSVVGSPDGSVEQDRGRPDYPAARRPAGENSACRHAASSEL